MNSGHLLFLIFPTVTDSKKYPKNKKDLCIFQGKCLKKKAGNVKVRLMIAGMVIFSVEFSSHFIFHYNRQCN